MSKLRKKFEEEHEEHIDESWLIPYADILTLLLALFIVLFAASSINKSKYDEIMNSFKSELTGTKIENKQVGLAPTPTSKDQDKQKQSQAQQVNPKKTFEKTKEEKELSNLMKQLETYISKHHLQAVITLQDLKKGVQITFKDVVLFDPGKADLERRSFKTMNGIIGILNTVNNPISIEGHTDNVPIGSSGFASNWELSSARAASVLHYFESKHVAAKRLQFTGFGEFHPLFPNDTAEHRKANRRVNIVILRNN